MIAVTYLRMLVAGVLARAWRVLRGRHCPCPHCRSQLEFRTRTAAACTAVGLGVLVTDDDDGTCRGGAE